MLLAVEGRADAITAAELGYAAVSVPHAGYTFNAGEAERIMAERDCVHVIADCDDAGRDGARKRASSLAQHGTTYLVDLAPGRNDKWDLGDVFVSALRQNSADPVGLARYFIDARLGEAASVVASADTPNGNRYARLDRPPSRRRALTTGYGTRYWKSRPPNTCKSCWARPRTATGKSIAHSMTTSIRPSTSMRARTGVGSASNACAAGRLSTSPPILPASVPVRGCDFLGVLDYLRGRF